ncbi:hypothetical protein T257_3158 [Clostridium botulinum CDC_297]|nr:hypothetical protein T257_3158 [Clostridium botulinum CDC_297]
MKSKRIIACLMALSVIVTSTLACGIRVQAESIRSNVEQESNIKSIIPVNQKFSAYYERPSGLKRKVNNMILYDLLKNLIDNNYYEKEDMNNKLNVFYNFNQIAIEQYSNLVKVNPTAKEDTTEKVVTQ